MDVQSRHRQEDGTWKIPDHSLPELMQRVEKLNKRTKKTSGNGLSLEKVGECTEEIQDEEKAFPDVRKYVFIKISGEIPVINGHAFIARIEHHVTGNIISKSPRFFDFPLAEEFRTCTANCEHCNTLRQRKDTFILRTEDGTLKKIGRNCLADFLRGSNVQDVLQLWSLIDSIEKLLDAAESDLEGSSSGGGRSYVRLSNYLACTASAVRNFGWVSRAKAEEFQKQATATVADWLCGKAPKSPREYEEWKSCQPTAVDLATAKSVMDWVETFSGKSDLSEYFWNMKAAFDLGYVSARNSGLIASAVISYLKEMELLQKKQARADVPDGGHFGIPEKRYDFTNLTVLTVRNYENDYGTVTMLIMSDAENHQFKWNASGSKDFKAGQTVSGKGTVKKHDMYEGRHVTILTRCNLTIS